MLAKPMNDQKDFNSPEGKSEQILESWALILKNPQKCPRSHQNQCPRSIRMTAHDASESVPTMVQNMQLDASALLAYLNAEPGADTVEKALTDDCGMSALNWAEVLSKVAEIGVSPETLEAELTQRGILGNVLMIFPLTPDDAMEIARLRPGTRGFGLSIGDRACLALGKRLGVVVLTADRAWADVDGVDVVLIR